MLTVTVNGLDLQAELTPNQCLAISAPRLYDSTVINTAETLKILMELIIYNAEFITLVGFSKEGSYSCNPLELDGEFLTQYYEVLFKLNKFDYYFNSYSDEDPFLALAISFDKKVLTVKDYIRSLNSYDIQSYYDGPNTDFLIKTLGNYTTLNLFFKKVTNRTTLNKLSYLKNKNHMYFISLDNLKKLDYKVTYTSDRYIFTLNKPIIDAFNVFNYAASEVNQVY